MVRIIANAAIPASAPTIPLTEFRQASAPIGSVNALLDRLTGSYGAVDRAVIRAAYNRIQAAGFLSVFDVLAFKLGNEADSLLNWCGGQNAENDRGTFGPQGIVLNGVDASIHPHFSRDGTGNYKLNDAHVGAYVSAVPNPDAGTMALIGRGRGDNRTALYPRNAGPTAYYRINADGNSLVGHSKPLTGLWHMGRSVFGGRQSQVLFYGAEILADPTFEADGLPPNSFVIGRAAASHYPMTICGWFSGGYLNTPRRIILADVYEMMRAHFVGPI